MVHDKTPNNNLLNDARAAAGERGRTPAQTLNEAEKEGQKAAKDSAEDSLMGIGGGTIE
jgi:hypothetical protein